MIAEVDARARGEINVTRRMLVDAFASGEMERIVSTFEAWQAGLPEHLRTEDERSVVRHEAIRRLGAAIATDPVDAEIAEAEEISGIFAEILKER